MTHLERRALGRFDTPWPLAQALADWAIRRPSDTVLEPSFGGGILVKSAIARLSEIGANHPGRNVQACDIDPRALVEATQSLGGMEAKLIRGNFLELTSSDFGGTRFDVVLGNPPYVRLHTMDAATRLLARKVLHPSDTLNAKASLWAYFPLHAFKLLGQGGRMGWILPETLLHAEYGKQLLAWATQKFKRCIAVSLRERCFLANNAKERVVILLLSEAGCKATKGVEMIEFATVDDCIKALPTLDDNASTVFSQLNGHAVPHLVSTTTSNAAKIIETANDIMRFKDFADVKIGVVTGRNKFFVLSNEQRLAAKLSRRHFKQAVGKFDQLGRGFKLVKERQPADSKTAGYLSWLLCPDSSSKERNLVGYLAQYAAEDRASNKTMKKRPHWQSPILGKVPDAFLQCMGKSGPRMVLNEATCYCTNTIHCVFFKHNVTKAERRAVCLSLHSSYSQLYAEFEGRQYGSGVLKFEPSEAKRLAFPFNPALTQVLSGEWTKLARKAAAVGWEKVVPRIDEIIAANCPELVALLPLQVVNSLLITVRQRRKSIHLGTAS